MISAIHYRNFRALRDATLPLGRFTLIVGPNGSGKSTAMQAFRFVRYPTNFEFDKTVTAGYEQSSEISVSMDWCMHQPTEESGFGLKPDVLTKAGWRHVGNEYQTFGPEHRKPNGAPDHEFSSSIVEILDGFRVFAFDAQKIAVPVQTHPHPELQPDGSNLAAVLDALTDSEPEMFEALNEELHRWLPEFDRILFETPGHGMKGFLLRTTVGHHRYRASDLSHGTLYALAFLTLGWLPNRPPIVCFEEPDRGVHPRLLNEIRDGMYRLCFPENFGDAREPVQVIATTHSPYLLDLYKEHPDEIVIAHKDQDGVHFERLSEKPHIIELLEGAPLGDIWYSGVLGGVPSSP